MSESDPVVVAIALSLYAYNVPALERARKLYARFNGECLEERRLLDILTHKAPYVATELPYPTAKVYVQHALDRYGKEAAARANANEVYV